VVLIQCNISLEYLETLDQNLLNRFLYSTPEVRALLFYCFLHTGVNLVRTTFSVTRLSP